MTEIEYLNKINNAKVCTEHHIKFTKVCPVCKSKGQEYIREKKKCAKLTM